MTKQSYPKKAFPVVLSLALSLLCLMFSLFGCKQEASSGSEAELSRAKKLIAQGNYAEAFIELNQALAEAPQDPNVHLNLGWLYLYTGDIPHAQQELVAVENLAPEHPETYHLRGALYANQAQSSKEPQTAASLQNQAIDNFQQALMRNNKNHQTYFDLAVSLAAVGRHEEALTILNHGFEYIPKNDLETQVNFEIATCSSYAQMQRFEEAIADCNQALEFTSNPASRERIEEMIQNMKLMNPGLSKNTAAETQ